MGAAPQRNLWSFLFVLFKMIELRHGIHRPQEDSIKFPPLVPSHYSHAVLLGPIQQQSKCGQLVHNSQFYCTCHHVPYYAIRASGYQIPSSIMQITACRCLNSW